MKKIFLTSALMLVFLPTAFADINVNKVSADLSVEYKNKEVWSKAAVDQTVSMMGQPMVVPKPKTTETASLSVTAVHDSKWIVFRMKWKDPEPSEAGKLATFSDAVALEFPVKNNESPPPIMMGVKDDPVQMFHWRYEYQLDAERGKKAINDIYPNMTTDMYPMDFKVKGNFKEATQEQKESYVGGTAAGNPQSFEKTGVDEILAEGFGTTALMDSHLAKGSGQWKNGEWTVYVARPLSYKNGSKLLVGKTSNVGFAVWQGGKNEVGAIKSLTMVWTPLHILEK